MTMNTQSKNKTTMSKTFNLSLMSIALFMRIYSATDFDRGYDEGYMYVSDLKLNKELRGHLTDLKKKGLLTLTYCDDTQRILDGTALYLVELTEKGQELAKTLNLI